ncbi:histidine phosphatase family protein [Aliirhizobium terrae]|uniref:histidine phosphatase family protein n=1 Tax=Terrirhizobium terrae TaxID=2926709 RepID=UPI0025776D57|nr:histidine phosphatase family protein [Rhizobium sp. CC-CFT758]WJH39387.1 histidine phosphatase family protein [Rhizobium sp. CC-CFT758]
MRDLFLVTHAQSVHHIEKRVGGWYDTELTERGQADASSIAERLFTLIGHSEIEIFSSDLKRASQTADPIGQRFERPVAQTRSLREISYGVAEGKPQEWLDARYTPAPDTDRLDHRGNIEEAESRRDVADRVYPFMEALLERDCEAQIIVTHGFTQSLVISAWMKVPIDACGFVSYAAPSGSITHLRQDDFFRNRAMISFADTSHLDR